MLSKILPDVKRRLTGVYYFRGRRNVDNSPLRGLSVGCFFIYGVVPTFRVIMMSYYREGRA
jgi:hypothetical protein